MLKPTSKTVYAHGTVCRRNVKFQRKVTIPTKPGNFLHPLQGVNALTFVQQPLDGCQSL